MGTMRATPRDGTAGADIDVDSDVESDADFDAEVARAVRYERGLVWKAGLALALVAVMIVVHLTWR